MYKFKFYIILFLLSSSNFVIAQQKMTDIVHLKNGSLIKCIILEQNIGKNIKIQTSDGSIYVYSYDEIAKIEKNNELTDVTNKKDTLTNLNPYTLSYRLLFLIPDEIDVTGLTLASLHFGKVFDTNKHLQFGLEIPTYYWDDGITSYPYIDIKLKFSYLFSGNITNTFFVSASLDYFIYDSERANNLGGAIGLGYHFKLGNTIYSPYFEYSYINEFLKTKNVGLLVSLPIF